MSVKQKGVALWVVQGLLAALFLFAGVTKLILPIEAMQGPIPIPGWFLRFVGVAETLGGLGLVLPGILRVRRGLTPVAAMGLVTIMAGATVLTLESGMGAGALVPALVCVLAAIVVIGRRTWVGDPVPARA